MTHLSDTMIHSFVIGRLYLALEDELCQRFHMTRYEIDVLAYLNNHPGHDTAREIVIERMLSKSTVSVAVDSLIQKGYLTRMLDTEDRRILHLCLTKSALSLCSEIQVMQKQFIRLLFTDFSETEVEQYTALVQKIIANSEHGLTNALLQKKP